MDKTELKYPVIVEGKYDKIKLASIISSPVIVLGGFAVFKSEEKRAIIKTVCAGGAIVLTDSDKAGMFIRRRLKGYFPGIELYNVYTPQISGKEKRKQKPSAEGLLGVEGVDAETILDILSPYITDVSPKEKKRYTKADFYEAGLSGRANSKELRNRLSKKLGLPNCMTANALLEAVNLLGADINL